MSGLMSRKLDAAIAGALGYEVEWKKLPMLHPSDANVGPGQGLLTEVPVIKDKWIFVPCYSEDGNAMLKLDREMRERGWRVLISYSGWEMREYEAQYFAVDREIEKATADTMPKAVALA